MWEFLFPLCVTGTAMCCNVLQFVAVCCSVLQCVAVCCSVLQFVETWLSSWRLRQCPLWVISLQGGAGRNSQKSARSIYHSIYHRKSPESLLFRISFCAWILSTDPTPDEMLTSIWKCLARHWHPLENVSKDRSPLNVLCKVTVELTIEKQFTLQKQFTDPTPDEMLKSKSAQKVWDRVAEKTFDGQQVLCVAVCCDVLQCVVVCCWEILTDSRCSVFPCVAVSGCCSLFKLCCHVLQCVAICCRSVCCSVAGC